MRRFVVEVSQDSPEADFSDVMLSQSRFLRIINVRLAVVGACLVFAVQPAFGQSTDQPSDQPTDQPTGPSNAGVVLDSLPALERARQFLIARQFQAALLAAEDAAAESGLSPAGRRHDRYTTASNDTASIHLYRGLALELQRMFPEARADYDAFLSIEPDSWRSEELLRRYDYVAGQTLRSNARRLRDEGLVTESGTARYGTGGFPLYNGSSILVMSQVAFGLTGVLNNSLGLLDHFTDQDLKLIPYSKVRLLLDEILPEEVYGQDATIDVGSLARILEVQFLTSGVLQEISGSLTGDISIGAFSDLSTMNIDDLQASYTPVGLLDLQRTLALSVADSIQSRTGFHYVPSRQAFADSIETYLIDDVGRLLNYGFALEQLLLGEPLEAQALLMNLPDLVAQRDLEQIDDIYSSSTPPADNILQLTALSAVAIPHVSTQEPDSALVDSVLIEPEVAGVPAAVLPSVAETRTAHVLSATAARNLGGFVIWGPTNQTFVFDNLQRGDPRSGVAGTLDPTRSTVGEAGVSVKVVIPLPSAPDASPTNGR